MRRIASLAFAWHAAGGRRRRWTNGRLWFLRCASHARWTNTRCLCKGIGSTAKGGGKGRLHEHQRLAPSLALLAVHSQRKGDGPPIRPGHHPFPPPPPSFLSCKVASKPGEKKSEVARHAVSDAVESAGKRVSEGKKNTVQQGSIRSSSHARRIR